MSVTGPLFSSSWNLHTSGTSSGMSTNFRSSIVLIVVMKTLHRSMFVGGGGGGLDLLGGDGGRCQGLVQVSRAAGEDGLK